MRRKPSSALSASSLLFHCLAELDLPIEFMASNIVGLKNTRKHTMICGIYFLLLKNKENNFVANV